MQQEIRNRRYTVSYMEQGAGTVTHPEEDYFEAVRANSPASTKEVADAVGVTRQGADYRLRQLREEGKVEAKMVGNSLVWTLVAEND